MTNPYNSRRTHGFQGASHACGSAGVMASVGIPAPRHGVRTPRNVAVQVPSRDISPHGGGTWRRRHGTAHRAWRPCRGAAGDAGWVEVVRPRLRVSWLVPRRVRPVRTPGRPCTSSDAKAGTGPAQPPCRRPATALAASGPPAANPCGALLEPPHVLPLTSVHCHPTGAR